MQNSPLLVDTHCHLDAAEFDADREAVVASARSAGVSAIVIPAVESANFAVVAETCRRYPGCFPAYGVHPMVVDHARPGDLQALRSIIEEFRPVAVGEIGLDFYVEGFDLKRQEFYFTEQLKLAREYDLPVILHVRKAVDAVIKQLRLVRVKGGIAHAFNGSCQQAEMFIGMGFKLGFGGAMTYERALHIRELAKTLPVEAIVLETDAPDIAPVWLGKQRNSPVELPGIAQALAELRGDSVDFIARQTSQNARMIFPAIG